MLLFAGILFVKIVLWGIHINANDYLYIYVNSLYQCSHQNIPNYKSCMINICEILALHWIVLSILELNEYHVTVCQALLWWWKVDFMVSIKHKTVVDLVQFCINHLVVHICICVYWALISLGVWYVLSCCGTV